MTDAHFTVNEIGDFAFIGAIGLRTIVNQSTTPQQINSTTFAGLDRSSITVYVPTGRTVAYRAAGWTGFIISEVQLPLFLAAPDGPTIDTMARTLNWSAVPNAVSYGIYVNSVQQATVSSTSWDIPSELIAGSFFAICAIGNGTTIFDSNLSFAVGFPVALEAPAGLNFNTNGILTWNDVSGALGYHIYVVGARQTNIALTERMFDLNTLGCLGGVTSC